MTDGERAQIEAAIGGQRGFPSRETGAHAVGSPEKWEKLFLRLAEMEAARLHGDGVNDAAQELAVKIGMRALCCLAEERHFCDRVIAGVREDEQAITQALGKALGYPEAYPLVSETDDGSVVVGDHVAATIAEEAAEHIQKLQGQVARWAEWHGRRVGTDRHLAAPPAKTILKCYYGADTDRLTWEANEQVGMPLETRWGAGLAYGYALSASWSPWDQGEGEPPIFMCSVLYSVQPLEDQSPAEPPPARDGRPFAVDDPNPFSYLAALDPYAADREKYPTDDPRHPDHPEFIPF